MGERERKREKWKSAAVLIFADQIFEMIKSVRFFCQVFLLTEVVLKMNNIYICNHFLRDGMWRDN